MKTTMMLAVLVATAPAALQAHGALNARHGGQIQEVSETGVELVTGATGVDVYLTDDDTPLAASGYGGKVTVTAANGARTEAPLVAVEGNHLTAAGLVAPAGSKVLVTLSDRATGMRTFGTFEAK
ncbi:MAG: hypothetical protein PGN23_13755 [Sphingomonas adhaesiva]|uniref:hypothetical protein n=1 Tax=Sphingomonas adhaesiva TaxID=28212 RepID=UPI002FF85D6E